MAEIPGPVVEENRTSTEPEFDGGAFTISAFSSSPEGFQFQTRNVIGKTGPEGLTGERALTEQEQARVRDAIKGEMKYAKYGQVSDAREKWRTEKEKEDADPDEIAALRAEFDKERERVKKSGKKIGIRDVQVDSNTLSADVKTVLFSVYNEFSKPGDREPILDLSAATGTAMILRSTDNRFVIQHRAVSKQRLSEPELSSGNASYNDQPGASVAGMLDASLSSPDRKPGTPDPIDTDSIKGNIFKEASEELGLAPTDMDALRIVGVAQDKVKIHDELLLLADTSLDASQIRKKSRESIRNNKDKLGEADFEEKFIDIPATREAVETLLTEVKCPLPPTHYATIVAAGYSIVLQESGAPAAEQWKKDLEPKMKANINAMNQIVSDYYVKYPEALTIKQVPERFWKLKRDRIPGRNQHGYTPAYAPDEQGLPSFEDEMTRTGLIPETRRHIGEVLMFDVDGPISDPTEKQIKHHELVTKLSERLEAGEPVFLNTGRSTKWVMERVVPHLNGKVDDSSLLSNLVIIGEKGGTWVEFDDNGEAYHGKSQVLSIPKAVNEAARKLVEDKYGDCMFFDATKQTMMSIEMKDGHEIAKFTSRQAELVEDLNALLAVKELENIFKVDATTIATDVESDYVGKARGADRCLQWLQDRGIKADRFVAFGDSVSDLEMADELQRRGKEVKFVYVGDAKKLADAAALGKVKDSDIITNEGDFSAGTLRYLTNN